MKERMKTKKEKDSRGRSIGKKGRKEESRGV